MKNCGADRKTVPRENASANLNWVKVRQTYWIPHGKTYVKSILKKLCKRCIQVEPYPPERMTSIRRKIQRVWKIWKEEYLDELRKRTRKSHKNPHSRIRQKPIIEVILLKGEGLRNSWKIGQMEKLIEGNDGIRRPAVMRMSNGIRMTRALGHLPFRH
ncbi:unnamed protein product [Onchocerca ochengi]|uniref:DUF5641 domain-containing protein n=1 Tax=Onchocerca ochengi TaxID=42157 RepID=A0A182EF80_ONCOC|nr:unnamed protein product [Onchocerca ochengi]